MQIGSKTAGIGGVAYSRVKQREEFSFTAFGVADWLPLLPFIFLFLFLSVWLPCCISDIVYPLLWISRK